MTSNNVHSNINTPTPPIESILVPTESTRALFASRESTNDSSKNPDAEDTVATPNTPRPGSTDLEFLSGATLDDIVIGTEAIYRVDKRTRDVMTVVKSIRGKETKEISMKLLRNWAVSLQIQMKKDFRKVDVLNCLVKTKTYRDRASVDPSTSTAEASAVAPSPRNHINNVRFINVLAKDCVKALLLQRGAQKTRAELENREDPDALLYQKIVTLYNDAADEDLLELKWEVGWTKMPEPSRFHPINAKKAKTAMKSLSMSYERVFANWKKSGHHEGIPTKEFHSFVGSSNYLDYLHSLLTESPGLLSIFKGDLPSEVFSEGGSSNSQPKKRARKGEDALEAMAKAQAQKAQSFSFSAHAESHATLELSVDQNKQNMRKHLRELKEHPLFRGKEMLYIKRYIKKIARKQKEANDDDDVELDFSELRQELQESASTGDSFDDHRMIVDAYLDCQEAISEKKKQISALKNAMSAYIATLPSSCE